MATDYNLIAAEYKRSKQQPWRLHIEHHTLFEVIGDLKGKAVLDLACGEGFYSRFLKQNGASRVVGVDLSERMIELARKQESQNPLVVEYAVGDAKHFKPNEPFDLVVAGYLLNYASTPDELLAMSRAIARSLKPGCRFVTVNNNPEEPPEHFASSRKYGFVKSSSGELKDGTPVVWTFFLGDGSFDITNYHLSVATHEQAFGTAGLGNVRWHQPRVSPQGRSEHGDEHWAEFLRHPPIVVIECTKLA